MGFTDGCDEIQKSATVDCKKTQKGQNQNALKVHLSAAVWE